MPSQHNFRLFRSFFMVIAAEYWMFPLFLFFMSSFTAVFSFNALFTCLPLSGIVNIDLHRSSFDGKVEAELAFVTLVLAMSRLRPFLTGLSVVSTGPFNPSKCLC